MIVNRRALSNDWLFHRDAWSELKLVEHRMNSISTLERDEDEQAVVDWLRNHPRRPLTEWSDLTDPFEPAGWEDWSPVRSVRSCMAGKPPVMNESGLTQFLAARRQQRREALEAEPS